MRTLKFIAAVFVGMMLGSLVIWGIETWGHTVFPPPPDLDPTDVDQVTELIANAPVGALLFVVLAYALGSFFGGLIAQLISNGFTIWPALITGLVLLIFGGITLVTIPHPMWMVISGILVFIPMAALGGRLVRKKQPE